MQWIIVCNDRCSKRIHSAEGQVRLALATGWGDCRTFADADLKLINDALDMSKTEARRMTLRKDMLDLYRLLNDLEEMLHLKAQTKGLLKVESDARRTDRIMVLAPGQPAYRILVVEDSPTRRFIGVEALSSVRFEVFPLQS